MKAFRRIIFFLSISLALQCQTKKESQQMNTEFIIDTQKVTYRDVELPLGNPLKDWINIFGKYDRRTYRGILIWDKLGIGVNLDWGQETHSGDKDYGTETYMLKRPVNQVYIFFNNLDTPLGQAGKLEFARGRESLASIRKRNNYSKLYNDKRIVKEINENLTTGSKAPKNYAYPFKTYGKSLNIEGIEIKSGMTVSQINELRKKEGLPLIGYWDTDMNSKEENGSLTTKSNGYFTYLYPHKYTFEESEKTNKYNILYRYTEQELEYIRIVHDTGQEYY